MEDKNHDINEIVKILLKYKGNLIKKSNKYKAYAKGILNKFDIKDPIDAFVMGAIDGMIYDIACSLDFTKQKGNKKDYSSYKMRTEILNKLWS